MDGSSPLVRLETWLRSHPFRVDVGLAVLAWCWTVLLPAQSYVPAEETALVVGTLLTIPLAWRRRRPVRAAAVVVGAGRGRRGVGKEARLAVRAGDPRPPAARPGWGDGDRRRHPRRRRPHRPRL